MKFFSKAFIIVMFLLLLVGAGVVLESTLKLERHSAQLTAEEGSMQPSLTAQKGLFEDAVHAMAFSELGIDSGYGRDTGKYYDNRAYYGAPPVIPHPIASMNTIGAQSCLKCHEKGGYVSKFKAFAPVTPHPNLVSCVQCHVPVNDDKLFAESNFTGMGKPELNQRAMMGSPPVIPHKIHMRETCLSCHSGPSAPSAIKTTHPERINCLQCHAKGEKADEIGTWTRSVPSSNEEGNENK